MKWCAVTGVTALVAFFVYMGVRNHYLNYAPEFETTIYHEQLDEHLMSTFEGKDVSSAERIYRWIAGVRMWKDRPLTGFGPGNFNQFYKRYTVDMFQTYVSDNPERSSVHNYFLLLLADQGLFGLIIFVAFTIVLLVRGERIYHACSNRDEKRYCMALLLSIIIIYVNTFLSDLLETDKIGAVFFICVALLVNQDLRNAEKRGQQVASSV